MRPASPQRPRTIEQGFSKGLQPVGVLNARLLHQPGALGKRRLLEAPVGGRHLGRSALPLLPGIEQRHSGGCEVGQVGGDHHQAVHQRRGDDQAVAQQGSLQDQR